MAKIVNDQMGNVLSFHHPPRRIISLVPSQTELLFDLGLDEEITGITDFCIYPHEKCRERTKIGGPKSVDFSAIDEVRPDVIIANKEENDRDQIAKLQGKFPVWVSDISTLDDALDMIRGIGELVDKGHQADEIVTRIQSSMGEFDDLGIQVVYFVWKDPYMVAGKDTFITEMLSQCGFKNAFDALPRYPRVTESQIIAAHPDVLLLCSEPYPFEEKHVVEFSEHFPFAKVLLVDGEIFSWYGSRLQYAGDYFRSLRKKLAAISKEA